MGSSRAEKRMSIQREGLSQKDIFEQKLEQSEAKSHVMVWRKSACEVHELGMS